MDLSGLGKLLLVLGVVIAIVGIVLVLVGRGVIPRLPGDFTVGRGNVRFFFPIGTSIVVSLVLTLLLNLFLRR